jgi:Rhodanese-related sulfurtransferase
MMTSVKSISAQALLQKDITQALVVDVRTPMEFAEKRLAHPATLAPVTELEPRDVALRSGALQTTPIYTLCASGRRAQTAAAKFVDAGFADVTVIEGGLGACKDAGFATVGQALPKTGETSPTLDRQVRLAAGALTAAFVLLGLLVHPAFLLGALFVGCGQVFSGLTNWCGLALLLARAPWNNKGCAGAACPIGAGKSPGASCQ